MAIVFAARGNSFDARYSLGGKVGEKWNSANVTTTSAGLSGTCYRFGTSAGGVIFLGRENTGQNATISVLMRVAPRYTGAPSSSRGYFSIGGTQNLCAQIQLSHLITTGNLVVTQRGNTGTLGLNQGSVGAWSPTSGTFYDIVLTYDGTSSANGVKVYVDASLLGNQTTTQDWASRPWKTVTDIALAMTATSATGNYDLDEFVIWDSVIDPTANVTLESGPGLLNGASRTSLVSASAFDALAQTDPGIANVRSGTSYTYLGSSLTGTCAVPTAANTKTGVSVDATTGTYDGSDRWTDPGEANVRLSTAYKANSTTNNKTGTLDLPAEADVKNGVVFDNTLQTGTYVGGGGTVTSGIIS